MVRGLEIFRERFRRFEGSFILIGGAACDQWFADNRLEFRATKDLDMVLVVEILDQDFVAAMRAFIEEGAYEIRQRSSGRPILYRFAKPASEDFPFMLELFTRSTEEAELAPGQGIIPVETASGLQSLSAILLNDAYYDLIRTQHASRDGLGFANATALIPLKAHAWLDLTRRRAEGETIDSKDIDKHRSDVFRLAATLPEEPGPVLPEPIPTDLAEFLRAFPEDSPEWPKILASLAPIFGKGLRPPALRAAIASFFRLAPLS
jgi:hypothetical protein